MHPLSRRNPSSVVADVPSHDGSEAGSAVVMDENPWVVLEAPPLETHAPGTQAHAQQNVVVADAIPSVVAENTYGVLPKGCTLMNRPYPRNVATLQTAFKVVTESNEHFQKRRIITAANWALTHFRALADPTRCGTLNSYELDITRAGPMDMPLPQKYPKYVLNMIEDKNLRAAVGSHYWYTDAEGRPVVTGSVRFDPQEFIKCLIRHGDSPCTKGKKEEEVICLYWRAWPETLDDVLAANNNRCAGLNWLEPPVQRFEQKPPHCDFVLYMRGFDPIFLHPGNDGKCQSLNLRALGMNKISISLELVIPEAARKP